MNYQDENNNQKQWDDQPFDNNADDNIVDKQVASKEEVLQTNDAFLNQEPQKPNQSPKQNRWALFISSLAGGITVAILGFILLFTGIIPIDKDQTMDTNQPDDAKASHVIKTSTNETGISSDTLTNVGEAVVGVSNIQTADLWSQSSEAGTGSGVIYKKEDGKAYIVTNHHVVDGANELNVTLPNGESVDAQLLGSDELTDLAVLTIDGNNVDTVATLGTSSDLVVGETAIAIGNPLGTEFAGSVTKGIISGLERSVEVDLNGDGAPDWTTEVIQTDAAINPGNSGGALVNSSGEVVGINSMKIALKSVEGIGFAIPIDDAKPVIEQLETNGKVSRPFIGISAVALSTVPERHMQQTLQLNEDVTDGVVIAEVQQGSAADQAGLKRYDVVTKINDKEITSMLDLKEFLYSETNIGDEINLTYYRQGEQQETTLTLTKQQETTQQ
ncbi:Serine protease Do-like HtrB [Paraliobacillus sp. PM-2]|uniref:S1C family serine protease n=1 Tax=Paraliobacillus sp. PM-2 TaxID=1462524 RepID=UPI00061C34E5|nr:S1C family serine protease [Paraliobacillus sp. PM-2]CQR48294.1 Serine protease Do-like HtrB [Paraliobacillus sp. PM-2]